MKHRKFISIFYYKYPYTSIIVYVVYYITVGRTSYKPTLNINTKHMASTLVLLWLVPAVLAVLDKQKHLANIFHASSKRIFIKIINSAGFETKVKPFRLS